MYIEKQWHQSIECNCTQKGGKKPNKQPQLLSENEEDFLPLFFHCRYDDRGSRSGPPTNKNFLTLTGT